MRRAQSPEHRGWTYFGYGSNLNHWDLSSWCAVNNLPFPFSGPGRIAYLPDTELVFNYNSPVRGGGALNYKKRLGQVVSGVLFEVERGLPGEIHGWDVLDRKEGVLVGRYERRHVRVLTLDGGETSACTYKVSRDFRCGFTPPTAEYVETVRRGLSHHGLSDAMFLLAARDEEPPLCADLGATQRLGFIKI